MHDSRVNLRNRSVALLLGLLLPGAGQLYQGRRFKAGVFFAGVLGLFLGGMILGEWQPVYSQTVDTIPGRRVQSYGGVQMLDRQQTNEIKRSFSWGYIPQVLMGLPAAPALLQQSRFGSGGAEKLTEPLESSFHGLFIPEDDKQNHVLWVTGTLKLAPGKLGSASGSFEGHDVDGNPFQTVIEGAGTDLGKAVFGSPNRAISLKITNQIPVHGMPATRLEGSVERPFVDWFQAPRDDFETNRLHATLSHRFDIAVVMTWIAGFLNMMVLWDAWDGPAYGYGDEKPDEDDDKDSSKES